MDFAKLGKRCFECKTKDFLPFKCKHCSRIFCIKHRQQKDHKCSVDITARNKAPNCPICGKLIRVALNEPPDAKVNAHITSGCRLHVLDLGSAAKQSTSQQCALPGCKNKEKFELVRCKFCHRRFCLTHRHAEDHRCPRLEAKNRGHRQISARERARRQQSAQVRELLHPRGSHKVPEAFRFYVEVQLSASGGKTKTVCFNRKWTVGKCVDVACDALGHENKNNDPSAKKTYLFGKKNGAQFPFDVPIELLAPALSAGDTLILGHSLQGRPHRTGSA